MKRILFITVLTAAMSLFAIDSYAQRIKTINPSGEIVEIERSVGNFTKISVESGINVEVAQSDTRSLKVKTDRNAINYVITEVKNGTLNISYADKVAFNRIRTTVYVTMPSLTDIAASGGSDVELRGTISGKTLNITASSAADIEGNVNFGNVNIVASSGSDITLSGKADNVTITVSSGSDVDAEKLISPKATVTASSGSDVKVYASDHLTATASSGSDIYFYGSPATTNNTATSGASIMRK